MVMTMTIAVDFGRKATKQTNKQTCFIMSYEFANKICLYQILENILKPNIL